MSQVPNAAEMRWVGCASCGITVARVDEVVKVPAELVSITLSFAETGADHP